jgi:hypothetical protein
MTLRLMRALVALSTQVQLRESLDALREQAELVFKAGEQLPEARDKQLLAQLHSALLTELNRR